MEPDFQSEYVSNIMPYSFEPTVNSVQSDTSDIIPSDSLKLMQLKMTQKTGKCDCYFLQCV